MMGRIGGRGILSPFPITYARAVMDESAADRIGFEVERYYLADLSFECPHGPREGALQSRAEAQVTANSHADGTHRVTIKLTAGSESGGKTVALCELTYVVVVRLVNVPKPVAPQMLLAEVPAALLPVLREIVAVNASYAGVQGMEVGEVDFRSPFVQAVADGRINLASGEAATVH